MAITNRPRLQWLIQRTTRYTQNSVGATTEVASTQPAQNPSVASADPTSPAELEDHPVAAEVALPQADDFARGLEPGSLDVERTTVSRLLYERLNEKDIAAVKRRIAEVPELSDHYATAWTPAQRNFLVLTYGLWLGVEAVSRKTGLTALQPPEEIHAMARGALAAGGGLYEADLVVDALSSAGADVAMVGSALDFGCSSARVVRVLAAAYPEIEWHGCDPNAPAIAWASENLPGVDFFVNDHAPPLPLADSSLDLVYAISIWSHFEPTLGLRWFEEMHRLIPPGGHLVCTTHGPTSVAFCARNGLRTPQQSQEITESLYRQGWWFAQEFGEEGDWGVLNPAWGTAFLSPEWMLAELCPRWRVMEFAPGRNQYNQDVYVLQRT
jgi:SAM-dependent methyltransferase